MASHPTKIGKYNVEGSLGRGGMGIVYKAVDSQIGRYVAIKMIMSNGDPSLLERFKSEARSTGSLSCPNIVTLFDWGEQDGNPYLVMQYLEGSSLEALIQKGVSLTLSERLGIIIDVCNGLAYAHQRGVIHRDIKPGNIMVLQDGVNDGMAVIVDFGIARIGGDTRLTKTDQIVGSVHYMSAEQLQSKELDNRTDIYAVGVVLFQLLTGALPFDSPDTAATLFKIVNEPPPPLSMYLKEYPVELDAIVNRVLAKKREERYASAKDLAFDLMQVQENVKSETVALLVRRAEASLGREDWTRAREQLQQVLRIDRQNTHAQKLMNAVQERLRQQQQIEQAQDCAARPTKHTWISGTMMLCGCSTRRLHSTQRTLNFLRSASRYAAQRKEQQDCAERCVGRRLRFRMEILTRRKVRSTRRSTSSLMTRKRTRSKSSFRNMPKSGYGRSS